MPGRFILIVLLLTALVFVIIWGGARALRSARRSSKGVGMVGWGLLFLTSGRMPPPPPASQIELDIAGKKEREASRDIGEDHH